MNCQDTKTCAVGNAFTLIEVMIALAVLSIVLVVVFQSQSQSLSIAGRARFMTTSALLAQSRMAEAEIMGFENLTSLSGDFGEDYPDYTWRIELADTVIEAVKKATVHVRNRNLITNNEYTLVYYTFIKK